MRDRGLKVTGIRNEQRFTFADNQWQNTYAKTRKPTLFPSRQNNLPPPTLSPPLPLPQTRKYYNNSLNVHLLDSELSLDKSNNQGMKVQGSKKRQILMPLFFNYLNPHAMFHKMANEHSVNYQHKFRSYFFLFFP